MLYKILLYNAYYNLLTMKYVQKEMYKRNVHKEEEFESEENNGEREYVA